MEGEDLARARERIEVVDEGRLFARADVGEGQGLVRGVEDSRETVDVLLRLDLDVADGNARGLRFAHADRLAIEEEEVIGEPVPLVELELAHRDGGNRDVHVRAVLESPA
jgi:hypothetical protein